MKNKTYTIGLFLFLLIGSIITFPSAIKKSNREFEERRRNYPFLLENESVSGIVTYVHCCKSVTLLSVNNSVSVTLDKARNYEYEIFELCCFLEVGDSIQRKGNCDTIFIYKQKQEFYFVLGEFIGEKYNSRVYRSPC